MMEAKSPTIEVLEVALRIGCEQMSGIVNRDQTADEIYEGLLLLGENKLQADTIDDQEEKIAEQVARIEYLESELRTISHWIKQTSIEKPDGLFRVNSSFSRFGVIDQIVKEHAP